MFKSGTCGSRTLATKTVIMRGTMSCMAPVVSITITVVVSVMRVAPAMKAAAPICKPHVTQLLIADPVPLE